jgi:adenylate cyclase
MGSFWCSLDFLKTLSNPEAFTFSSKGNHSFKNVSDETDVLELMVESTNAFYIDPVCRMLIHKKESATPHPYEQNIFFCSADCLDIYIQKKIV